MLPYYDKTEETLNQAEFMYILWVSDTDLVEAEVKNLHSESNRSILPEIWIIARSINSNSSLLQSIKDQSLFAILGAVNGAYSRHDAK